MNSREKLAAVKSSVSIVDLLRSHRIAVPLNIETQLKCPFHGADNHASARIYPQTNTLYCWTCKKLWDVVAVEMQLNDVTMLEALDSLIANFNIDVKSQPYDLVRFYNLATTYQRGDPKNTAALVSELGDQFRRFYTAVPNWYVLGHLIDYFWQEYDELVQITTKSPSEIMDCVLDWYARAHSTVASQVAAIQALGSGVIELNKAPEVEQEEELVDSFE